MAIITATYFGLNNNYRLESRRWLDQPSPVHEHTNSQFLLQNPDEWLTWDIPNNWENNNTCQSHGYNRPRLVTQPQQLLSFVALYQNYFRFTHHRPTDVEFLAPGNLQYEMDVPYIVRGMATALSANNHSIYRMVYEGNVARQDIFRVMRLGENAITEIRNNMDQENRHLLCCE